MKSLSVAILACIAVASIAFAQEQAKPLPQPSPQDLEVIRVSTELVQTDVMVFDKQGHFVDGLQRDQFELRVDGKPQPVSLFDRVVAGSQKEEQLVSTRKNAAGSTLAGPSANAEQRGRTVVFFIDDLHLSASSVQKTRHAILEFIEKEMSSSDQVAVASASGQIGFLQQFTDNKTVLRAAVARLNHRPYTVSDSGATMTMTEYNALRIDQGDKDPLEYYATQLLKETNFKIPGADGVGPPPGGPVGQPLPPPRSFGMTRESAERMVKERANNMLKQAGAVTNNTLLGLESLMRSSAQLPGRKLVFLVSDGFFLNDRNTGFGDKLKQITDAALRAGAVIYSLDARGMVSMTDVASNRPDPEGHLSRSNTGELSASQDPLYALAEDTGGRALLNSDALNGAVSRALNETSNYYLLAWRPTEEEQKTKSYKRIEVSVIGRPELVVKLPKGYLQSQADTEMARADAAGNRGGNNRDNHAPPTAAAGAKDQPVKSVDAELNKALAAFADRKGIPTTVSVAFIDTPDNGPIITASVQTGTAALDYGVDNKEKAAVDIAGVVLNDQGKPAASFKTRVTVAPLASARQGDAGVVYNYKTPLKPGLYQVRTAARDQKSGKVGSASQWIEIPDLSTHRLTLSSLLLVSEVIGGDAKSDATKPGASAAMPQVQFSVDRRFKKSSQLSFWIFIYNTLRGANGASAPDVTAQIEMFSNGKPIVKTPLRKLDTAGMTDLQRIPYGGQFPLANLPAGRYDLNVTITDQLAKSSVSQHVSFQVE
jgi:VWFA-related protein